MALEMVENQKTKWIVDSNGRIKKEIGEYTVPQAPMAVSYPQYPEIKENEWINHMLGNQLLFRDTKDERLSRYFSQYDEAEKKNDEAAKTWGVQRKWHIRRIKARYTEQHIGDFFARVFQKTR